MTMSLKGDMPAVLNVFRQGCSAFKQPLKQAGIDEPHRRFFWQANKFPVHSHVGGVELLVSVVMPVEEQCNTSIAGQRPRVDLRHFSLDNLYSSPTTTMPCPCLADCPTSNAISSNMRVTNCRWMSAPLQPASDCSQKQALLSDGPKLKGRAAMKLAMCEDLMGQGQMIPMTEHLPHLLRALFPHYVSWNAKRILVHRNHLRSLENAKCGLRHVPAGEHQTQP